MTPEERKKARAKKFASEGSAASRQEGEIAAQQNTGEAEDHRFAALMERSEDDLLNFVAKVNKVYQDLLDKPAPFMTYVFCGMQSTGKSTIMERFLGSVLNIVQEGTGTRCPLDTTCVHDNSCEEPLCDLSGDELSEERKGEDLSVNDVFRSITEHNRWLASEDRFSTKSIRLVYRSKDVQSMRFVDTPGIISNKGTGKDNREEIKEILRNEIKKPHSRLCVLLEPKEFDTNAIINICDESFGERHDWVPKSTFLMTKFDKQLEDSQTGVKTNRFFQDYFDHSIYPHLVITPTLARENHAAEELFEKRLALLTSADDWEKEKFKRWQDGQKRELATAPPGDDEPLDEGIKLRIGFSTAKEVMRSEMIKDTVGRLPEVLATIRADLEVCEKEKHVLETKKRLANPDNLRLVIIELVRQVTSRILNYLDGDLELSTKFPDKLQTLEEEIEEEENSDWKNKYLNHYSEREDEWRDRIAELDEYPPHLNAGTKFLGGKQYHRALELYRAVMIDALPNPFELKGMVANSAGFLSGGLRRENWEHAMVEVTRVSLKNVSHPGINFLVKHVGCIFRRLFSVAIADVKEGNKMSAEFKLLPQRVERFISSEYDDMLWSSLKKFTEMTHFSLEPMYSTIDPHLPTFHPGRLEYGPVAEYYTRQGNQFVKESDTLANNHQQSIAGVLANTITALVTGNGTEAKEFLKKETSERANRRTNFLPDERASMITEAEINLILSRSFEYIVALFEFILTFFNLQINHHLYEGFKKNVNSELFVRMNKPSEAEWAALAQADATLGKRLDELEQKISALQDSLHDVQVIQQNI